MVHLFYCPERQWQGFGKAGAKIETLSRFECISDGIHHEIKQRYTGQL